jgi:predicted transcriptional regulator
MESYESARSLVSSRLRLDILGSLESPMRLADLRRAVGANAPNTSTKAKDLQQMGLIERNNGDFRRTHMGGIVHERLSLLLDTMEALLEHREFWAKLLDNLPPEIKRSVHIFKGARLVRNSRDDLHRVEREIVHFIKGAKGIDLVTLPAKSTGILKAIPDGARLLTPRERPELRYGLVSSESGNVLFTELLDMALIAKGEHANSAFIACWDA